MHIAVSNFEFLFADKLEKFALTRIISITTRLLLV